MLLPSTSQDRRGSLSGGIPVWVKLLSLEPSQKNPPGRTVGASNTSVKGLYNGSVIAAGVGDFRVCFDGFIADGCRKIQSLRISPSVPKKFLLRRHSNVHPGLLSSAEAV